jgi:zinc protease
MGRVTALEKITLDDVKAFYRKNYMQGRLLIGLAGRIPDQLRNRIEKDFQALPPGGTASMSYQMPSEPKERTVEIIERETRSTAISLGFPITVRRGDKDWPALALVSSYLGQHRSSNSHLYQRLREARGLNYGDYAYIEYFPRGMFQFEPDPNLGRQQQIFQIWIRPVQPMNAMFALRGALYEYEKLVRDGLSKEDFEATREFLQKYVNVLTASQDARLGYALDSKYYRIPEFDKYLPEALAKLTLEDVNRAIKKHLKLEGYRIVMVAKDGKGLRDALASGAPSPITYNAPKPKEITEEDKAIEKYPLKIKQQNISIVPAEQVFQ